MVDLGQFCGWIEGNGDSTTSEKEEGGGNDFGEGMERRGVIDGTDGIPTHKRKKIPSEMP